MRTAIAFFLALLVLPAFFSSACAQQRPAGLPPDQDVIAFGGRAEGALQSDLHKYKPVAEAYLQRLQPAKNGGWTPVQDYYALGRFTWAGEPMIENLIPHDDK